MTKEQYLKIINKELQKVNKKIDIKIIKGQEYSREAREHKLLLRKARQFQNRSIINRILDSFLVSKFYFR